MSEDSERPVDKLARRMMQTDYYFCWAVLLVPIGLVLAGIIALVLIWLFALYLSH